MIDIIILLVVLLIIIFAVKGTIKHFRGEGGCCGGGSKGLIQTQEKKLKFPKTGEKRIQIQGMHCKHCAEKITKAINEIDGAVAKVNLKKAEVIISYDHEINDDDIKTAIEKAGYKAKNL